MSMTVRVAGKRSSGVSSLGAAGMGAFAAVWLAIMAVADARSGLEPLELLIAKDAIREKIALYTLLHDGDGVIQDGRTWADALWTVNASFQVVYPGGKRMFGNGETGLEGRETIFRAFGGPPFPEGDVAIRHVLMQPVFDSVTRRTAQTRTVEIVIRGRKLQTLSAGAAEAQSPVDSYIMHDFWKKGDDGEWRKSRSVVYCTVACPQLLPPVVK
jgi:hypothetical protein